MSAGVIEESVGSSDFLYQVDREDLSLYNTGLASQGNAWHMGAENPGAIPPLRGFPRPPQKLQSEGSRPSQAAPFVSPLPIRSCPSLPGRKFAKKQGAKYARRCDEALGTLISGLG